MKELLFLTDRYPYNNSEAFIENEIDLTAKYFDKVYILPCGLMVDTETSRKVPSNVQIIEPPCQDDIYKTKPSVLTKIQWGIKNLLFWYIKCLFTPIFYSEIKYLCNSTGFSLKKILRVLRTLAPSLRNEVFFRSKLKNEEFSNVYVYSYWLEPTVLFVNRFLPNGNIKRIVSRTHRWDLYSEESPIRYLPFQQKIIEKLDQLYVISNDGKNYLENKYPEFGYKMKISRLGTRDFGLNPVTEDREEFIVVSCSNIYPVKRVNLIIDTLSLLDHCSKRIKWVHFGTGQYAKQIQEYAKEKLEGKIAYKFMGQVSNAELMNFYQNNHVDLFINTSSSEGIPVSIMEAISFGIPVVATDVGGTCEIVQNNRNGFLLQKDFNIKDAGELIRKIMNDESLSYGFRCESRNIWDALYNSVKNFNCFYREILDDKEVIT